MKAQQNGVKCYVGCLACSGCGCGMVEDRLSIELHRCEGKVLCEDTCSWLLA